MNKTDAIQLLGGTVKSTADACEISPSAVSQWPDVLTKDQIVRVQAALYRLKICKQKRKKACD